ncbi:MAG TPA: hypothetical protein VNF49_08945 [Candidatus Binataceae bacterium]|nr:hypothetical protein [Candidatus Binataceae bacterium]
MAGDDGILLEEPIGLFLVFADRLFVGRIEEAGRIFALAGISVLTLRFQLVLID